MFIFIISFATILYFSILLKKYPFNPVIIYVIVWGFVFFLWSMDDLFEIVNFTKVTDIGLTGIIVSHISFITGSLVANYKLGINYYSNFILEINKKDLFDSNSFYISLILFILCAIGYVLMFNVLFNRIGIDLEVRDIFQSLNDSYSEKTFEFGGISGRLYVLPALAIPYNLYVIKKTEYNKKILWILTFIEVIFLISPRRALLFQTLTLSFIFYLMLYKISFRKIIIVLFSISCLLIFFVYTQSLLNKSIGTGFYGSLKDIYVYISGNIPAFELQVNNYDQTFGQTIFNVPFRILTAFGIDGWHTDLSIKFVSIPVYFNTIPYFYYTIKDFNLSGSSIVIFLLSFLITLTYRRTMVFPSFFNLYLFAILINFILFSFREMTIITYNTIFFISIAFLIQRVFLRKNRGDKLNV